MRLFEKGDMFELAGKSDYKVIFANDDYFVCCPVSQATKERGVEFLTHLPEIYSNKGLLHEKYWVKRLEPYGGAFQEVRVL